jgi:uncharacterized oxidoreductase
MKIENNTVLITGGGSGIGLEIAKFFYGKGNEVIICGRRLDVLEAAKEAMPKLHLKVADLSNADARVNLVKELIVDLPTLNILVNNAGAGGQNPTQDTTDEQWEREIDLNLNALFKVTREFEIGRAHV